MVYQICFENYQGETFTELYRHQANAYARMRELRKENRQQDEFSSEGADSFSFFDADYNENSTYITLKEFKSIDDLFED